MRIYLLNNTKPYRDGDEEYAGEWFNCPVDFEEVRENLGVEHEEQIEIADYELPFDIHSDMPLWEINANCRMVLEMEGTPIGNEMKAIQQKWFDSFEDFIDHKDEIRYYDVGDGAALAEYLICEEYIFGEIPHELLKHEPKTKESDGTVDAATTEEVTEFLETFFKLYPTATEKELAYYVSGNVLEPVNCDYVFSELVTPIFMQDGEQVKVLVSVKYLDQRTKATQISQFDLTLEKGSNWKIVG